VAEQEQWSGERVARWLRRAEGVERQLAPVSDVLFAAASLHAGERVLDVGCGTGPTTFLAAEAVGPTGAVVGVDISAEMLEAAASNVRDGLAPIEWIEADAVTWDPPEATFDVVLSRFGVMFFSDPSAAFANIRRALRPSGRLAFVCWQAFEAQEWMRVPAEAAGVRADWAGGGPNPFAFADRGMLARYLDEAGFVRVDIDSFRGPLVLGGATNVDDALAFVLQARIGRQIVEERGDEGVARVREALEGFVTPHGVQMECAVWVVRAEHG